MTAKSCTTMSWGWCAMPKITTRVTFNKASVVAKIKAANNVALTVMGNQVLEDSNQYCPEDQHVLVNSSYTHSDREAQNGVFRCVWSTPYARYLWHGLVMHGSPGNRSYGPDGLHFTKDNARPKWAIYARSKHGDEWKQVFQAAARRYMRGTD